MPRWFLFCPAGAFANIHSSMKIVFAYSGPGRLGCRHVARDRFDAKIIAFAADTGHEEYPHAASMECLKSTYNQNDPMGGVGLYSLRLCARLAAQYGPKI